MCRLNVLESLSGGRSAFFVVNVRGEFIETDLLSDTFSPLSVLGSTVVVENGIDLLERQTLELGEEKPGVEESDDTEAHEDDVGSPCDVVEHDRGDFGNGEV